MAESDQFTPPATEKDDIAHSIVKAAVSAVPYFGGPAAELFDLIVMPPLEKRRQEWMEMIANEFRQLKSSQGLNLEQLQSNDTFINVLIHASTIALRNHQKEKLNALKNAVINSAIGTNLSEEFQILFTRYVDDLIPSHLVLLNFLAENEESISYKENYEQIYQEFDKQYSDLLSRDGFKMLFGDLTNRGFVRISDLFGDFEDLYNMDVLTTEDSTREHLPKLIVTSIGKDFLSYING